MFLYFTAGVIVIVSCAYSYPLLLMFISFITYPFYLPYFLHFPYLPSCKPFPLSRFFRCPRVYEPEDELRMCDANLRV